jgi:hypothetical protein
MNFTFAFTLAVRVIGPFQTSGNTQLKQCHIPTEPESSVTVATAKTELKAGRHRRHHHHHHHDTEDFLTWLHYSSGYQYQQAHKTMG